MMLRSVLMSSKRSLLVLCMSALIAGLACGKYGRPERISQPDPPVSLSTDTSEQASEQDRDEAEKSRKP